MAMRNLQGELKNLKAKMYNLKKSGHSSAARAAYKDNGIMVPRWKKEGHSHHPTWWSTTYFWNHGAGVHSGSEWVFANLAQATADNCASVTNLTTANRTLTEQVELYTNRLSTKD